MPAEPRLLPCLLTAALLVSTGCSTSGRYAEAARSDAGDPFSPADDASTWFVPQPQSDPEPDAGICAYVACFAADGGVALGRECTDAALTCPWRGLLPFQGNLCPGSYLGCDSAVRAISLGACRYASAVAPDAVRIVGGPDDAGVCLGQVATCGDTSAWQFETSDAGSFDRTHFRLCGAACAGEGRQPDLRVEAVSLCRETGI